MIRKWAPWLLAVLAAVTSAHAAEYSYTNLGTLGPSYTTSKAAAVNDSGQVVGWSWGSTTGGTHGFLYTGGSMQPLGTLEGYVNTFPTGINSDGVVVGYGQSNDNRFRAFRYTAGSLSDLGTFGPTSPFSAAGGINNSGQIVGWANPPPNSNDRHAFFYNGTSMQDLGTLGGAYSRAYAINSSNSVVGESWASGDSGPYAFFFSDGTMIDLGTLGGFYSCAFAVNDFDQIVGTSTTQSGLFQAFLYHDGQMDNLGTLPGGFNSVAKSVNNAGYIVGSAEPAGNPPSHAFVYRDGAMFDLNDLTDLPANVTLTDATAISNSGYIVGQATVGTEQYAYLLTPVPEPGAMVVVAVLSGAVSVRRLRREI